jgi:hypothetical protein
VSDAAFRSSVLGCALAIAGCGNAACPDGFVQIEGSCVLPVDAPAPVDTGSGEDSGAADDAFVGIDAHVLETPDAFVPSDAGSDAPLPDAFLDIDGCTPSTFYVDNDGDGFGNVALSIASCEASVAGYSRDATDCDDDCNGCHPGGTETCDGRDNDCVGGVDDGVLLTFHADCDRDGYTAAGAPTVLSCTTPATGPAICPSGGWAGAASPTPDCNDACAVCFPGNPEVCDELDNNCDLSVDEGVRTTFVADCDGDTFTPTGATTIAACTMPSTPPSGCTTGAWRVGASGGVDCNDNCASCYPGGTEVCDGLDQDCVSGVDNGVLLTFYRDCDGDGYTPSPVTTTQACTLPSTRPPGCATGAWRASATPVATADCLDTNAMVFRGQSMFFTSPISGRPVATDYDYNCDAVEEALYPTAGGTCPAATTTGVCGVEGWVGATVFPCEDSASHTYQYCNRGSPLGGGMYTCLGSTSSMRQQCR